MKFRKRTRDEVGIDMGAFSDVAFLLIIFFILTTTLETVTGRLMDIPAGEKSEQKEREQMSLNIAQDAVYFGKEGSKIPFDELQAFLAARELHKRPAEERVIVVETKDNVPYEVYFRVITDIAGAGGTIALVEYDEEGGAE